MAKSDFSRAILVKRIKVNQTQCVFHKKLYASVFDSSVFLFIFSSNPEWNDFFWRVILISISLNNVSSTVQLLSLYICLPLCPNQCDLVVYWNTLTKNCTLSFLKSCFISIKIVVFLFLQNTSNFKDIFSQNRKHQQFYIIRWILVGRIHFVFS